ncbi:MAG: DUF2306 domain-containing protein [Hyphomicrobium sp.]|nr:DUF2306 domain-containing protein [Hyphomicrobium sp.]
MTIAPLPASRSLGSMIAGLVFGLGLAVSVVVAFVALGSGAGIIALPFEMWLLDQALPVVFRLHMLASAIALLLLPVVIGLRGCPELHRKTGWLLGAFVVIGGLTSLPVAIASHSGAVARLGFLVQGLVWLGLFAAAIVAIRRNERAAHAVLMLAMTAVTTGAVWFRLITGSAIWLDLPFEAAYAAAAWLGWLLPLAAVVIWRRDLLAWAFRPRLSSARVSQ